MKLRFTPRATRDLVDIAEYLGQRSPSASVRVRAAILDSLQNLVVPKLVGVKNWLMFASLLLGNIHTSSITALIKQATRSLY